MSESARAFPVHEKPLPPSLPHALLERARGQGDALALRQKTRGIWHERTWSQVAEEVAQLARGLHERGFATDDSLLVVSEARFEPLLLSIAAQSLGGHATLLDPSSGIERHLAGLDTRCVFVESEAQAALFLRRPAPPIVLICGDARGMADGQQDAVLRYEHLLASHSEVQTVAPTRPTTASDTPAFVIAGSDEKRPHTLTHGALLRGAHELITREAFTANDEALAARTFSAAGHLRYLVAPWLLAGFRLNFPESLLTRDNDRRELGPTVLLGNQASYAALEQRIRARLPLPGSLADRLFQWATRSEPTAWSRHIGNGLIRRPLRDVMGFSRLRSPLLVGEPLPPSTAAFYRTLGIVPRACPDHETGHLIDEPAAVPVLLTSKTA